MKIIHSNDFITLEEAKNNYNTLKKSYKLNPFQKLKYKFTKKNITKTICIINIAIPMTAWPVTNPIIIKISNKLNKDKLERKINTVKMRFM